MEEGRRLKQAEAEAAGLSAEEVAMRGGIIFPACLLRMYIVRLTLHMLPHGE